MTIQSSYHYTVVVDIILINPYHSHSQFINSFLLFSILRYSIELSEQDSIKHSLTKSRDRIDRFVC